MHTAFGIGSPTASPLQTNPLAFSSYGSTPGFGAYQTLPSAYATQQSLLQWLQILPQQLQQLQQVAAVQQQQLQQVLQIIPGQLQQLQQLIQFVPQQLQQLLQLVAQQQFGANTQGIVGAGLGHVPQAQGFGVPFSPFSTPFGVPSGQVM